VKKKKLSSSSTRRDDDDDDDDAPLHAKKQTIVHTLLQTLPLYWKQGSTMTSTTTSSSSLSLSLSLSPVVKLPEIFRTPGKTKIVLQICSVP